VTNEGRAASTLEELTRAAEELRAADQLLQINLARIALTRAYFACFHAVRAALYRDNLEPKSHLGALSLFNLHFVKTGRVDVATSRLLARLQKFREEADYGDAFVVDDAGAHEEIEAARGFVANIERLLATA
jgi:uncharacterized protein (UPF0332 family)